MIRPFPIPLLCISLCWGALAFAGLKEKPPKDFDATSLGAWQIDVGHSDDPKAILDKAREKMAKSGGARRSAEGGFGGSGAAGSEGRRGRGGGGGPGGRGQRGMPPGDAPLNGGPAGGQFPDDLTTSPATLSITRSDQRVKILTGEHSVSCMAGAEVAISDSSGTGKRHCGWSGAAWVVETKRGNDQERTDRYEPTHDGKTLTYTTTVSSQRTGSIKIVRVYTRTGA